MVKPATVSNETIMRNHKRTNKILKTKIFQSQLIILNLRNKMKIKLLQKLITVKKKQIHHNKNKNKNPLPMKDLQKLLMIQDFCVLKNK